MSDPKTPAPAPLPEGPDLKEIEELIHSFADAHRTAAALPSGASVGEERAAIVTCDEAFCALLARVRRLAEDFARVRKASDEHVSAALAYEDAARERDEARSALSAKDAIHADLTARLMAAEHERDEANEHAARVERLSQTAVNNARDRAVAAEKRAEEAERQRAALVTSEHDAKVRAIKAERARDHAIANARALSRAPSSPATATAMVHSGSPGGEGDAGRGRPREGAVNDAGPAAGAPTAGGPSSTAPATATATPDGGWRHAASLAERVELFVSLYGNCDCEDLAGGEKYECARCAGEEVLTAYREALKGRAPAPSALAPADDSGVWDPENGWEGAPPGGAPVPAPKAPDTRQGWGAACARCGHVHTRPDDTCSECLTDDRGCGPRAGQMSVTIRPRAAPAPDAAPRTRDAAHLTHGRADEYGTPLDPDCPCRSKTAQSDCAKAGCGFCRAAEDADAVERMRAGYGEAGGEIRESYEPPRPGSATDPGRKT